MQQPPAQPDEMTTAQLIGALHAGRIAADQILIEQRHEVVAHLSMEGLTCSEIAHIVGTSERTVRRDRAEIRRIGAMQPSRALGDEMIGELHRLALAAVQRLQRAARDPNADISQRLRAEQSVVTVYRQFVETAFRLKYIDDGCSRIDHEQLRRALGDNWFEDFARSTTGTK